MYEIEEQLRNLKPVIGNKTEALWYLYQCADRKGKPEIEALIQMLAQKHLKILSDPILLPPPSAQELTGEYVLGDIVYHTTASQFGIRKNEWIKHLGIFGQTGSGKTTLCLNLLKQLIDKGTPFLIFDYKRNYRDIIQLPEFRDKEILIFTVGTSTSPFYFNPKNKPPGIDEEVWIKRLCNIIEKAYFLGYGAMDMFLEASQFKTFKEMEDYLKRQRKRARELLWWASANRALRSINFPGLYEVVNCQKGYSMEELLQKNVILELDGLSDTDKSFLIGSILLWIYCYRLHEPQREVLKHFIIIEEAHNVFLKTKNKEEGISDIIMREIRELGESIIILDQHPSKIADSALGNLYTKVALSLALNQDVYALANAMLLNKHEQRYFAMLALGQGIVKTGRFPHPVLIRIPAFAIPKGSVTDGHVKTYMQPYLENLRHTIQVHTQSSSIQPLSRLESLSPLGKILLVDIYQDPFSGVVQRYKRLGLNVADGNRIQEEIIHRGLVQPVIIDGIKLLELTDQGKRTLTGFGYKDPHPSGKGGLVHRYYAEQIRKILIEQGYAAYLEKDDIDVMGETPDTTIAVEIETGKSNLQENIRNLITYPADTKLILTTNKETEITINSILTDIPSHTITVHFVKDFIKHPSL